MIPVVIGVSFSLFTYQDIFYWFFISRNYSLLFV
jgi:hypothetical protein